MKQTIQKASEKKEQKKLDDLTERDGEKVHEDGFTLRYSVMRDEVFGDGGYVSLPIDYIKMFYGEEKKAKLHFDGVYAHGSDGVVVSATSYSETMTKEEAEETIIDLQYAAALFDSSNVSATTKKRFATWCMFNQSMMMFFQNVYGLTGDVNYSSI